MHAQTTLVDAQHNAQTQKKNIYEYDQKTHGVKSGAGSIGHIYSQFYGYVSLCALMAKRIGFL